MISTKDILTTSNLSIGYKTKHSAISIAENLSLNLQAGKLVALIGANGIGKSTLLRTITGIQKPLSGTILLNGKNIHEIDALTVAQNLSVVLTEKLPPSNLTVFELIALGRQPYTNWIGKLTETDIAKVNEAMELTQISHLATKKHYEISDGQLQKVLVARALALTQETNKCILFSTHDIDMAIQLSDEMIIMTPETVVQDEPCNFISKGTFNTLFKDEHIVFDSNKGKFVIV